MTEDESKQDEEKLEFTPEGETLGYISLDQARVSALQHARDNRKIYGRYADRELVWEVIADDETEDFYEVKLTYRPAGGFRGRPGLEQFTIDKTGSIEFRQVVSQPIEKRRWVLLASVAIVVALVVVGAVAAATFVWGGKPSESAEAPERAAAISPQVENSEELIEVPVTEKAVFPQGENSGEFVGAPARGAWFYPITVSTPLKWSPLNGDVTITLDAGSVDRVVGLEFDLVSEIPQLPAGFVSSGTPFDLSVQPDHDSAPIPYTFLKPLTLTFKLSGTDATLARGDESNVVVQSFKDDAWARLTTAVDFGSSTARVQVDNLSLFALTIWERAGTSVPAPTPAATLAPHPPTSTPTPTSIATTAPTPTSAPAATVAPASTATPAPTSTPTPEPTPTALLEPTLVPEQFTNIDEFGFALRLDGGVDVQGGGWTEAKPTAEQGRISFEAGGINAILIWSPAGDQSPLNFLADTYNILGGSQPDLTLEPATEGEIIVSQQDGIFGGFTTSDASGTVLGGGLIATWICPEPGTAYRLTVTGADFGVTQIRFDRLVGNFACGL